MTLLFRIWSVTLTTFAEYSFDVVVFCPQPTPALPEVLSSRRPRVRFGHLNLSWFRLFVFTEMYMASERSARGPLFIFCSLRLVRAREDLLFETGNIIFILLLTDLLSPLMLSSWSFNGGG